MSTIALCIPAYNAAKYLPALLMSAKNQVFPFNEILVYNDCSTDETTTVAKEYGATVIEGKINVGCSTGKNRLAEIAKSEWLHFHDADDLLLSNFMEIAHSWISSRASPDIVLLHFNYINYATGELLGEPFYSREALLRDVVKFSIENKIVNFALVKKSSFIKIGGFDIDPNVLYNEDRAFYTRASIAGLSMGYENTITCTNYFHPESMSAKNMAKCAKAAFKVWQKVLDKTEGKYNSEIAIQLLDNATLAATCLDWKTSKASVTLARLIYPTVIPKGSKYFKILFKIAPCKSFYIREILIRNFTQKRMGIIGKSICN